MEIGEDLLAIVERKLTNIVGNVSAQFLIWSVCKELEKPREQLDLHEVRTLCTQLIEMLEYIIGPRGVSQLKRMVNSELSTRYQEPPELW